MPTKENVRAETVDRYLAELPEDAGSVLGAIREVIKDAAPGVEEAISYGIPLYKLHGQHLIGFGSSKRHLSLFVIDSEVLREFQRELEPFDQAGTKTTIRFTADKPLPKGLVKRIVKTRANQLA